jgi:molybdate transport system ATP-binding protein
MIEIRVRRSLGAMTIEADIRAEALMLALVGPSGGGKTTLLNMIAGLETPDEGRIAVGDVVLFDAARRVNLPPSQRRIGYVFQEPRLFPHYSVAGNLRYGCPARPSEAMIGFDEAVARLGIANLLDRRPAKLSGGEQQRVAIGRALLAAPRALLLDEPFSALDPARRKELMALVADFRDRFAIPMILVSHRHDEVERLADAMAVVEPGRKVTLGTG